MSRRREIDGRIEALGDIGKIMRSMKNLSYMETRKLARFLDSQRRVVAGIDAAARDFLGHWPELLEAIPGAQAVYVLIGAERGFGGSFDEKILKLLELEQSTAKAVPPLLIAVGAKLASALGGDARLAESIPGASAAEEIPAVLSRLVQDLNRLTADLGAMSLTVLHWDAETEVVSSVPVLPPFQTGRERAIAPHPFPPGLSLTPERFLALLIEHYLFAALHEILYSSLMAEHQQRVRHLEGALGRVDDRIQELTLRRNALRQEEITEEIELILLNRPSADASLFD
jgi:F-type H+-transporting ATPase subunit gamma